MNKLIGLRLTHLMIISFFLLPHFYALGQETYKLSYTGSSTIGNFITRADQVYNKIDFNLDTEPESAGGEVAILEGRTDLAGVANIPSARALGKGVVSTLIGWDAIAIITHESNPIKNLTITQLQGIFTGKFTNWNQLGGPDLLISPFITGIESYTHKVFRSVILGELDYKGCEVIRPDIRMVEEVKNNPGSIGHISYSFILNDDELNVLSVNNQSLSLTNANYPITRPLYLLWWSGRREIAEFVEWTLSSEGQRLVMEQFIGIRESTINLNRERGFLIVYTSTYTVEDGGTFYYPHNAYEVLSLDKKLIMRVANHLSSNDENPTKVELTSGSYFIRPESESHMVQDIFAIIEPGKVTKVNVPQESGRDQLDTKVPDVSGGEIAFFKEELNQLDVLKNIHPYGDMRIRAEQDHHSSFNRFRGRFRARAGVSTKISPDINVDLRFTSSANPDDPNSPYADFTDGFNQVSIVIDRAYFHYRPHKLNRFSLWLGKFPSPFTNSAVYSEIIWDADIHPEGIAMKYDLTSQSAALGISIVNGSYLISQFITDAEKNWLNASQLSLSTTFSDQISLTIASSLYLFSNIKDQDVANTVFDANSGNSTYTKSTGNGVNNFTNHYASNFYLTDNLLLIQVNKLPFPLIFKTQYFHNLGAEKNNIGYAAGFSYGALNESGQLRAYYQYQYIQQDAVFSPFVQDDFIRQTNFKGHVLGLAYAFHKKVSLHAWGLTDDSITGNDGTNFRIRLDLNVKI